MLTANFRPGTLVILSGAPGSGKSSLALRYSEHVVSLDTLRSTFFGYQNELVEDRLAYRPRNTDEGFIFETLEKIIDIRMKNGMTTIVDATSPTDSDRRKFAKIAEKYGRPVLVCILDVPRETLYRRNVGRQFPVSNAVVDRFVDRLELTSSWPFIVNPTMLDVDYWTIPADQPLDIVGDIHGCIEVINLVQRLGYIEGIHPQGRKLIFLADLIDRGPDSLVVLHFVMDLVAKGNYCVLGNHEANLLKGLQGKEVRSHSTRTTLHEVLMSGNQNQKQIQKFIEERPAFYLYGDKTLICHADTTGFYRSSLKECVYGNSTRSQAKDSDAVFAAHYPDCRLIRGHIGATSPQPNVISLEEGAGYNAGPIVALRLNNAHDKGVFFREPTTFVYVDRAQTFEQRMEPLISKKLVAVSLEPQGNLKLYKYTQHSFYTDAWKDYPDVALARAAVIGLNGERIGTTFSRTRNYKEVGAQEIEPNREVIWVNKLNGFFAQVLLDPYSVKPRLVFTSSGMFTGEFVDMARRNLERYSRELIELFKMSGAKNLMFEIIDPKDPHIVEYSPQEHGAYLIGAGYENGLADERVLDYMSLTLGIPRPAYGRATYEEVLKMAKACDSEGYMVRDLNGDYLVKLKSPRYVVTKFISRMSSEHDTIMFKNPDVTKQKIRARGLEELQFVVDLIVSQLTESEWKAMNSLERRNYLLPIVKSQYA